MHEWNHAFYRRVHRVRFVDEQAGDSMRRLTIKVTAAICFWHLAGGIGEASTHTPDPYVVNKSAETTELPEGIQRPPAQEGASSTAPSNTPATAPAIVPLAPTLGTKLLSGKDLAKSPIDPSLIASEIAIAEKLRDLLANKADLLFERKVERQEIADFYRNRGFRPVWLNGNEIAPRTTNAIDFLRTIGREGLDPADYPIPDFRSADATRLADAELKFTHSILDYARHAQTGRVHFSRISADVFYSPVPFSPRDILSKLTADGNVGELLNSFNPSHLPYQALKAKLAEIRGNKFLLIKYGPVLRFTPQPADDERVPSLRKRLELSDKPSIAYDREIADAVARFQREQGLVATGTLTRATVDALNSPKRNRTEDVIIANMERWRWMPRDLGSSYSILNIPDFSLKVVTGGRVVWQTKAVVGKPATATPILSDTMKYITVNPTWNVPPSIINNEYLPALQRNPNALSRMGIEVVQNSDGSIRMFQPPGERNALGRLRFNFPNQFLVYQHDTPDKRLFDQEKRAFSHGCMRIQNPEKYAEIVLSIASAQPSLTAERIKKLFGTKEQQINLTRPFPVHITYQTAFVSETGRLVIRDDLYGHDARFIAMMKSEERRVADFAARPKIASAPVPKRDASGRSRDRAESPFERWLR